MDLLLSFDDLQGLVNDGIFSKKNSFTPSPKLADKLEVLDALQISAGSNIHSLFDSQLVARVDINPRLTEWLGESFYCELGNAPVNIPPTDAVILEVATSWNSIKISWSGATDDVEIVSYKLYIDGVLFTTVNSSVSTFTFIGLVPQTSYSFIVVSVDNESKQSPGLNQLNITTLVAPTGTITAPTIGLITDIGENTLQIEFSGATATAGIKGYNIYVFGILADFITTTSTIVTGAWVDTLREGNSNLLFIETVDTNDDVSPTKYRMPDDATSNSGASYTLFYPINDLPIGQSPGASRCLGAPDFIFHVKGAGIAKWYRGETLLGSGNSITITMPTRTTKYFAYIDTDGDGLLNEYIREITVENCNIDNPWYN